MAIDLIYEDRKAIAVLIDRIKIKIASNSVNNLKIHTLMLITTIRARNYLVGAGPDVV